MALPPEIKQDPLNGVRFVEAMEAALATREPAAAAEFLDPEVAYTVGAQPTRHGVEGVIAYAVEQGRVVRWTGHTLRSAWASDDGLVVEVVSHFLRVRDGERIDLPCTDVYRFREGRIHDWRVYADMSPFSADSKAS